MGIRKVINHLNVDSFHIHSILHIVYYMPARCQALYWVLSTWGHSGHSSIWNLQPYKLILTLQWAISPRLPWKAEHIKGEEKADEGNELTREELIQRQPSSQENHQSNTHRDTLVPLSHSHRENQNSRQSTVKPLRSCTQLQEASRAHTQKCKHTTRCGHGDSQVGGERWLSPWGNWRNWSSH